MSVVDLMKRLFKAVDSGFPIDGNDLVAEGIKELPADERKEAAAIAVFVSVMSCIVFFGGVFLLDWSPVIAAVAVILSQLLLIGVVSLGARFRSRNS